MENICRKAIHCGWLSGTPAHNCMTTYIKTKQTLVALLEETKGMPKFSKKLEKGQTDSRSTDKMMAI
jgi:hypothetical protein